MSAEKLQTAREVFKQKLSVIYCCNQIETCV